MDSTSLARQLLESVPANRSFGLHVLRADATGAEVTLELSSAHENVIGSLHSSGLIALIDAAGLAALIGSCQAQDEFEGLTPLGTTASLQFLAPARGRLVARCVLDSFERHAVRELLERRVRKEELETCVEVVDRDETVVCRGRFAWKVRRAHAPGTNGAQSDLDHARR
jgi:acyl-coenzyme A thioesterase PaaI-like protein